MKLHTLSRMRPFVTVVASTFPFLFFVGCTSTQSIEQPTKEVAALNPNIEYSGRYEINDEVRVTVGYSGARARLQFEGTSVALEATDDTGENYVQVWIDGKRQEKFKLDRGASIYPLAHSLAPGEHTVEVMRITECFLGLTHFDGFKISEGGRALPWGPKNGRRIEFIGDSITCGYGVEVDDPELPFEAKTENFSLSYSGLTARRLDADFLVVARSGIGMTRNYDGPWEGSESDMPSVYPKTFYEDDRFDWDFSRFVPDVVCINLGTNDFSTTGVDVERYISDYVEFARGVLERYPETELVVLQGPMNNSEELGAALQTVVNSLKEEEPERVHFFELSPQGPVGFGASYHPNRKQSEFNATELTQFLSDLMNWN